MTDDLTKTPKVTSQLRVHWVPFLALVLFAVQQFAPAKVLMSLSVILGGLWLVSWLWARSLAGGLRIERIGKYGWSQVGDVFEEKVHLKNTGLFPAMWLLIEDRSTLVGHTISLGTGIEGMSSRQWTKRTVCAQRGEYQLGPTAIESGDPFGLYRVRIEYQDFHQFVVSPPVIELPMRVQISSGDFIHDNRFANRQTRTSNVSVSVRQFAPGDTIFRVHWLTTARLDEPFVRQYENIHASNSCWIVLDLDEGVHVMEEAHNSLEDGIILTVSLANRFLLDGLAVGLLAQGDHFMMLPPSKGAVQFRRIQRTLATVQAGEESLKRLLLRTWSSLQDEHNLVVVTPSKQPEWLDHLVQMRRSHVHPSVFTLKTDLDTSGEAEAFGQLVRRYGIKHYAIQPEIFDTPETAPGKRGVVQWRFTPLGRAIKVVAEEVQP